MICAAGVQATAGNRCLWARQAVRWAGQAARQADAHQSVRAPSCRSAVPFVTRGGRTGREPRPSNSHHHVFWPFPLPPRPQKPTFFVRCQHHRVPPLQCPAAAARYAVAWRGRRARPGPRASSSVIYGLHPQPARGAAAQDIRARLEPAGAVSNRLFSHCPTPAAVASKQGPALVVPPLQWCLHA